MVVISAPLEIPRVAPVPFRTFVLLADNPIAGSKAAARKALNVRVLMRGYRENEEHREEPGA